MWISSASEDSAASQLAARLLTALDADLHAVATVFAGLPEQEKSELRERMHLAFSVPELRAAILDRFASAMRLLTDVLAERTGRPADDIRVRTLAGAVIGAVVAVTIAMAEDFAVDFAAQLDAAMAFLEAGLDLPPAAPADQPTPPAAPSAGLIVGRPRSVVTSS